jgi:seryl-tRNA synthetase
MLDIKKIREQPDDVRQRLAARGRGDEKTVDQLLALDEKRRQVIQQVEVLKAERNKVSKEVGARKAKGESAEDILVNMKAMGEEITRLDQAQTQIEADQNNLLLLTPNLPHPSVPPGLDAAANRVERTWGEPAVFDFAPKPHWELAEKLGLLDLPRGVKISGSGFALYVGAGARLERSLINFLLDLQTQEHGYTEIAPPYLVRGDSMTGTGQLPKFAEDMYRLEGEDLYLIPTAEVPVTNLHREEILAETALPLSYAAYTPCFRKEAGSAGKDTRGLIRLHQFDKVELVHITHPDESYNTLTRLVGHAEKVLQKLGLHYRILELCAGDMSANAAKCYDLEVWAPGLQTWLEVSSCSNFEDYQARRMNLRFKDKDGKNRFCHTLNGSGTALARLYIALLETHQQKDGSILLPTELASYFKKNKLE